MTTIPPEVPKIQAETTRAGVGSPIGSMLTGERVEPISPQERFTPVQQTAGKTEVVSADVMKKSAEEAKKQLDAIKQAVTFLDEGRRSKRGTKAVPSSSVEKTVGTSPGPLDVVEKLITDLTTIDLNALSFDQKNELKNLIQTMLVASNLFYHFSKEKNLIFQEFIKRLSENIASNYEQIKKIKTAQSRLQDVSDTVFPDMKAAYGDLIERGKRLAISVKQKTDTEISEAANAFEKEATAFASKYEQIKKIKTAQSRLRQLFVPVSPEMKAAYDGLTRQGETLTSSLKEKTDTEISESRR